jgi:hypothetical protein
MSTTYRVPTLKSRREYFRLPYPVTSGAVLAVGGTRYKVDEISERGLRVVTGIGQFEVNSRLQGELQLAAGLCCVVTGRVLRVDGDHFVVLLEKGPTCYDVIREQRHLSKTHPEWKPQPA